MPPHLYVVIPIPGLRRSESRAIAFLSCDGDPQIDAKAAFDNLSEKRTRELMTRFDYWIDGKRQDDYFHGWPNEPSNKECFVFKWKDKKVRHRLYGFLVNPKPKHNHSFRVCILVSHDTKGEWETDPQHKALANAMKTKQAVVNAVQLQFPDLKAGNKSWLN
jgi:hypothetical protein